MNYNGAMNFKWENVSLVAGSPFCLSACPSSVFFSGGTYSLMRSLLLREKCVCAPSRRPPETRAQTANCRKAEQNREDDRTLRYVIIVLLMLFFFSPLLLILLFRVGEFSSFFPFSLSLLETQTRHVMDCTILFLK